MRRRDPLPPDVARALEDLDAAVAGAPGADPELATLVADVREMRPEPDPAFLATLDARVLEGFGGAPPRTPWHTRLRRPQVLLPGLGIAVAAVLVVVIASSPNGTDDASVSAGSGGGATSSQSAGAASSSGGAESSGNSASSKGSGGSALSTAIAPAAPAPGTGNDALGRTRRVERNAELILTTPPGDVQAAADGVVRATQAAGGYVAQSQVQASDSGGGATFTLRVPVRRLDAALASLSKLGHVSSLSQGSSDITGAFVSVGRRLGDAAAERRALLRALGRATTSQEIDSLRARLRLNRSEIAALQAERGRLRTRTSTATVAVTIEGSGKAHEGGGGWTPGDALHDA